METEAGEPVLWSRGVRRPLGWLLMASYGLPLLIGGVKLISEMLS